MTEGTLLGGLGLDEVPDGLPEGTYQGFVFDFKFVDKKDKQTQAVIGRNAVMTYKVADPASKYNGEEAARFQSANAHDTMQQKRFLKQMFTEIGVPESRLGTVTKEDIVGTPVLFTLKKNGQYTNVTKVALRDANGQVMPTSNGAPAQPVAPQSTEDIQNLL